MALAGCSGSESNDQNEPETQRDEQETPSPPEASETASDPETEQTDETSTTDSGADVPEGWDDNEVVRAYKNSLPSWAEIVVSGLDIPDYSQEDEVVQYSDGNVISGDSEGEYTIEVDLDSGVEELRRYVSNNIIEDNRDETVSVLISYQEPVDDLSSIAELQDMAWIWGIPLIPSMFSELRNSDDGGDYPIDNYVEEGHLFDETVIETFFEDYVSGVRDSGNGFPEEILEYAEQ